MRLNLVVYLPDNIETGSLEGLLGNFNGDPADDTGQLNQATVTEDQLFSYSESSK